MKAKLEYHPLSELFPLLEGAEFDALVADIKSHGLREPIVVDADEKILDGRNRYRACLKARVYPVTRHYNERVDGPVIPFVISLNLHRRHLDESQRGLVAGKLATMGHGGDRRSGDFQGSNLNLEDAAELVNVGRTTAHYGKKVAEQGIDELQQAVARSEVSVSTAADVAELPEAEQREIVARGADQILAAAKAIRTERREQKRVEVRARLDEVAAREVEAPTGQYDVVVIDPPWPMEKIERDERPNQVEFAYPTMSEDQLRDLQVPCADDCHVWLWTTHKFLPMAFRLLDAWGLAYVCAFVWHKPGGFQPYGLPQFNCEFALYARKGAPIFLDTKALPVCFDAARGEHSEKPEAFYEMVRRVTAGRRIDMFNRREIEGFQGWGKEAA